MSDTELIATDDDRGARIRVHFDTKAHELSFATFVATGQAIEQLVSGLDQTATDGVLKYELRVLPPEEGGFWEVFAFIVTGGGAASWAFLQWLGTDNGKAFLEGYSGKDSTTFFREVGEKVRRMVIVANARLPTRDRDTREIATIDDVDPNLAAALPTTSTKTTGPAPPEEDAEADQAAALAIAHIAPILLEAPKERFEAATPKTQGGRDLAQGRNKALSAWKADRAVRAVGFRKGDGDPIKRRDFEQQQVAEPEVADPIWFPFTEEFDVDSPVFVRTPRGRAWHATDTVGRERLFDVEDEDFMRLYDAKDPVVSASGTFRLGVQGVYRRGARGPRDTRVLNVTSFNGRPLAGRWAHEDILAAVGQRDEPPADDTSQPELFDPKGGPGNQ